jgi:Xaa-Pro aminopeptidase
MRDEKVALHVGMHDGAHFIEKPNPVMVLSGFKSLGPAAALLAPDGAMTLVVTPHWDSERAAQCCPDARVVGVDNVVEGVLGEAEGKAATGTAIATAGLRFLPYDIASHLTFALPGARSADKLVFDAARAKTTDEIASAREATRIAERGYEHLIEIARPGMSEDELAVELKWFMKTLGAEDNFLLICAGPHNRAVQPSTGRKLETGDIILAEITPSFRGQLAQICRTVVVGAAGDLLRCKYALVVEAMNAGIAAAAPGVRMADVCGAVNAVLEQQGYGEYCRPPHIRRRGHGLGFRLDPADAWRSTTPPARARHAV